ncbi:MAG: CYTH domain-containing protein [Phycisphaerales bacterium]|nr:CYTH domain-containing protein [Phycisphaerales bacterium]
MLNIEYKAELRERELARGVLQTLGAVFQGKFEQTDVFVRVPEGRLKRRECAGEPTRWIWYQRSDQVGVRESHWTLLDDQQVALRFEGLDRRPWKRVVKCRELWTLENVRIHLDEVLGIGSFLEFEGVVQQGVDASETRMKVEHLVAEFRPLLGEPIASSYEALVEPLSEV